MVSKGKIAVSTPQHINEAIEGLGEEVKGTAVNPAKSKLFYIDDKSPRLSSAKKDIFHSITSKVLWISQRSRPDLDTAVSFLCTRVKGPTEEDWEKLCRVIYFLKATKEDKRIIGMGPLGTTDLDGWVLCGTHRYEGSYWRQHVFRMGTSACQSIETEIKFEKFNGNRGNCSEQVSAIQNMVNQLHGGTRVQI